METDTQTDAPELRKLSSHPLLFEMLRSFTTLARMLNLSHAVDSLGSTRQTVRRHIAQLEAIKGGALFDITDRRYQLTDLGAQVLPEAWQLMAHAQEWVSGQSRLVDGLQYLNHQAEDGWCFVQQQKPMGCVFSSSSDMLRDVLSAWSHAGGQLEHDAMLAVRPLCNVFRPVGGDWLFTEVGERSSFATWFGWTAARSTIGRPLGQMPGGDHFGRLVHEAYAEIEATQSVRLDHIYTILPLAPDGVMTPICYERLLLGAFFADNSFAMLSLVRRTYDVEIQGVTDQMIRKMPEKMLM